MMADNDMVTARQIADVIGKSVQFINRIASNEGWRAEVINKRGDRRFYLESLPPEIQEKIMLDRVGIRDDEESVEAYAEAAQRLNIIVPPERLKDPKVAGKFRMVCECLAVPAGARGRRERIRQIAESFGYNVGSAYRLIDRVKNGKELINGSKNHGHRIESLGITVRAWAPEAAHMAIEEIMSNRRSHAEKLTLYERVRDRAKAQGLAFGCYESFLSLHKKISGSILTYRDKGIHGLREDIVPAIQRDHTAYRPMECLVGDQHKADYYCVDYTGNVVTLELFCWLDFRTQMAFGAIAYKHYNRYTVGQALINAVRWGMPAQVYTDWGKPEESNYTNQLIDQLSGLGVMCRDIRRVHAKVRHPQAKPIEPYFGRLDKCIKNTGIPGYCKRLHDDRENELQQKEIKELEREHKLLSIDEMTDALFDVIEERNDHIFKNRGVDNGKSPRQIYYEETRQMPVTTLSDDVLDYIFLPVISTNGNKQPLTVKRSQVKIRHEYFKRVLTYYSPELSDYNGAEVSVRFNPFEPSRVWIFATDTHRHRQMDSRLRGNDGVGRGNDGVGRGMATGRLLCVAEEWGMINPKNMDQVSDRIATQERLIKRVREKYQLWLPDKPVKENKVRVLHPLEREARAYTQSKEESENRKEEKARAVAGLGDIRLLTTQLEDGRQTLEDRGQRTGYRPLTFENRADTRPAPTGGRTFLNLTIDDGRGE